MRLYEDDNEEIRPSFSFGDEKSESVRPKIDEDFGRHYDDDARSGSFDPVSRVQTKLNIISIIIPCIVTIAILVIYFQIKGELANIQNSGSSEIKNLSLELQTKVTDIENRLAGIEQKLNTGLEAENNSIKGLDSKITAISQSKADKKDFEALSTQANAKLEQIQKSASDTANAAAEKIKKDVEANIGQMQKNVDSAVKSVNDMEKNLGPEIDALKGSVSEATSIAKSAQKDAAAFKSSDYATRDDILKETRTLETKIRDLEQKIARLPKSGSAAPLITAPKAAKSASSGTKTPAAKEKVVKSEPVEEPQEIQDNFEEPAPDLEENEPAAPAEPVKPETKPSKSKGGISEQNL